MILMTQHLIMRPPEPRAAPLVVGWLNDPEVVKFSEQRHKQHTVESQLNYWKSPATYEPNLVRIIELQENYAIGSISATIDQKNNIADVGILIGDKSQWGRGFGYEAWECVCNYLFFERKIRKIEAGCMSINKPMIRLCEKYMMRLEGTKIAHFDVGGMTSDMLMYGKFGP